MLLSLEMTLTTVTRLRKKLTERSNLQPSQLEDFWVSESSLVLHNQPQPTVVGPI